MILLDTSALVALAIADEKHHERAVGLVQSLPPQELAVSDYVFDETVTLIRSRRGVAAAVKVGEAIRAGGALRLVRLEQEDLDRAWQLFRKYDLPKLSFTDCATAALAERLKPRAVFAFDDDFRRLGAKVVP